MAKHVHMSGYEAGCFFQTTHISSQMNMYVRCLPPCNQMHTCSCCMTKMHIHKWGWWWTHAGKRNDTHPGPTGYNAQMPLNKNLLQPEVWAQPICVNSVHPSLNSFSFSSSGWNFASFYKGHCKSHGGGGGRKLANQWYNLLLRVKYILKEWALSMAWWFFSWMVLKFFHGLGSKSCWLLRYFINMKELHIQMCDLTYSC